MIKKNKVNLSLREEFLEELDRNIAVERFKEDNAELRRKLKKAIEKGNLFSWIF